MPRGLDRFQPPQFGMTEAAAIHELITTGRRSEADDQLRHLVHIGVAPSELFDAAMALARSQET